MTTTLERAMPGYHFSARHSRWIAADASQVWRALNEVTLGELTVSRLLVAVRHPGRSALPHRPLLTTGPVHLLETSPPWYAVGGNIARPWQRQPRNHAVGSMADYIAFAEPGWAKYLVDFHIRPSGTGVTLTTVTRVHCTSRGARRRFAAYWTVIRLASGLIRRDVLAAVGRLACGTRQVEAPH